MNGRKDEGAPKMKSAATKRRAGPTWANRIVAHGEDAPDELLANPVNWRTHGQMQQQALSSVPEKIGLVQSVVVNQRSGFVIDGHLRVTLAIRSGQAMVPVTYVDLSELLGWLDWCERADGVLLGRSQRLAHRHATGCPLEDAQWRAAEQRLHVAYRSQDLETWRAELTAYESFALNYFAAYEKEHGHAQ